jgi:hypothetical protein
MRTQPARLATLVLCLLPALWGCPGDDRPADDLPEATAADPAAAEQAMQTVLTRVVEAQQRHFEAHNHYADSIPALEEYGFRPVEDTHVTLGFQGTQPEWGYLATAIHTFSNHRCEVLHGRATDGREYAGQIECTAEGAAGPQPALPPGQTGAGTPGAAQPGATGTTQPGAPGTTPQGTQPGTTAPGT